MSADQSSYAALGLHPGADSAEIEQAYRRLIKKHHPDREGGDGGRAAEINRAYRELRGERTLPEPLELTDEWPAAPSRDRAGLALALLLAAGTRALLLAQAPIAPVSESYATPAGRHVVSPLKGEAMDQPLHLAEIDAATRDALHLSRTRDEMALASASRDCHHALRSAPTVLQLDRCAAFDDAVVQLQDRDPLRDQGPFSELAVTGRLWSSATALSQDSVAIEGRLDRIRLRVELALASAIQPREATAR